jgi:hypothetical protein
MFKSQDKISTFEKKANCMQVYKSGPISLTGRHQNESGLYAHSTGAQTTPFFVARRAAPKCNNTQAERTADQVTRAARAHRIHMEMRCECDNGRAE